MREPVGSLTRRHAGALAVRERCHVRAAAIIRGDDPDVADGRAAWDSAMRETWGGAGDTLERAAALAAGDAVAAALYARFSAAAELAARMTGLLAEAGRAIATGDADPRWPDIVADLEANAAAADRMAATVAAEAADHRATIAIRAAGLAAWAREVYGAPPLAIIEAAHAAHAARRRAAGDPRDVPEPGELAASWRRIAGTLEAIVTAESPDPAAVDTEAAFLAESARLNGEGA